MELHKIEVLLEKYFDGTTSIAEEKDLKNYFSSLDVAQHLKQYQSLFNYFDEAKEQKITHKTTLLPILRIKNRNISWLSAAASIVILFGVATFAYLNFKATPKQDLGTFEDPEMAFKATQKALNLLSQNVNVGVESVQHINEFEDSKKLIFKNINTNYNK